MPRKVRCHGEGCECGPRPDRDDLSSEFRVKTFAKLQPNGFSLGLNKRRRSSEGIDHLHVAEHLVFLEILCE